MVVLGCISLKAGIHISIKPRGVSEDNQFKPDFEQNNSKCDKYGKPGSREAFKICQNWVLRKGKWVKEQGIIALKIVKIKR